jgi:hypothetical protein
MIVISAANVRKHIQANAATFHVQTETLNMHQIIEMETWSVEALADYEERAAIYEIMAGKQRESANAWAYSDVYKALHGNASYYPTH